MTVNETLKCARLIKGLTIYRLSKMCGVPEAQINQIENEVIKNPQFRTVAKIAEALHLSLDEIYQMTKEKKNNEHNGTD